MRKVKEKVLVKLNLGRDCPADFKQVESVPSAESSVDEFRVAYFLDHIPGKDRGKFLDSLWKALKPKGKCTVVVPYWTSMRGYADFAQEWPPISEMSFLYFNRDWRVANQVHPEMKCDFDFTYGYMDDAETSTRQGDVAGFWRKHYTNAIQDLHVTLVKR